jgi:hypothetical protein
VHESLTFPQQSSMTPVQAAAPDGQGVLHNRWRRQQAVLPGYEAVIGHLQHCHFQIQPHNRQI